MSGHRDAEHGTLGAGDLRCGDLKGGDTAHSDPRPGSAAAAPSSDILELGEQIATLAAHIHSATHRLLVMLAEFDRRGGWKARGHASCAHWLSFRTGIDMGAAREKVRAARASVCRTLVTLLQPRLAGPFR
jgi:hypothetical protein